MNTPRNPLTPLDNTTVLIERVATTILEAHKSDRRVTLLLGAGCSVSAGIASADGFVKLISTRHRLESKDARSNSYADQMHAIGPARARDLVLEQISNAQLNAAHVAIAQLVKLGFVDRILTTNFDPLINRACVLAGINIATYDIPWAAPITARELDAITGPAVFHIHGQHTGFRLLHTTDDLQKHKKRIRKLFTHQANERVWVVAGYSGINDPVADVLMDNAPYGRDLFWLQYKYERPIQRICDKLITLANRGFAVEGYDADRFFIRLATLLHCFPPDYLLRPFSYLHKQMNGIAPFPLWALPFDSPQNETRARTPFTVPLDFGPQDYSPIALIADNLQSAIVKYETETNFNSKQSAFMFTAGNPKKALSYFEAIPESERQENWQKDHHARCCYGLALKNYIESLDMKAPSSRRKRLSHAADYIKRSIIIDASIVSFHFLAGVINSLLAEISPNGIRKELWQRSRDHLDIFLEEFGDDSRAWNMRGYVVQAQALQSKGSRRIDALSEAISSYTNAYKLGFTQPGMLNCIASCYMFQIDDLNPDGIRRILQKAESFASEAEELRPGSGAYNLACIAGRRGDVENVQKWLLLAVKREMSPKRSRVAVDVDFKLIRKDPRFKEVLELIPK